MKVDGRDEIQGFDQPVSPTVGRVVPGSEPDLLSTLRTDGEEAGIVGDDEPVLDSTRRIVDQIEIDHVTGETGDRHDAGIDVGGQPAIDPSTIRLWNALEPDLHRSDVAGGVRGDRGSEIRLRRGTGREAPEPGLAIKHDRERHDRRDDDQNHRAHENRRNRIPT